MRIFPFLLFALLFLLSFFSPLFAQDVYSSPPFIESYQQYWLSPSFEAQHPGIIKLPGVNLWTGGFESELESVRMEEISLHDSAYYSPFLSENPNPKSISSHIDESNLKLASANEKAALAKTLYTNAKKVKDFSVFFENPALFFGQPFYLTLKIADVYAYTMDFGNFWKGAMSDYISSHGHASAAINLALSSLSKNMQALDFAGADSNTYAGIAKADYLQIKNEIFAGNSQYYLLQNLSSSLSLRLIQKLPPDNSSSYLLFSLLGASPTPNLLETILAYDKTAKNTLIKMENEADFANQECEQEILLLDGAISQNRRHNFEEFDEASIAFINGKEITAVPFAGTLSDKFFHAQTKLANAQGYSKNARSTLNAKNREYASLSISQSGECIANSKEARTLLGSLEGEAQSLVSTAREKANQEILQAQDALSAFPSTSGSSEVQRHVSQSLLERAQANFTLADSAQPVGEKFRLFVNSISLSMRSQRELSQTSSFAGTLTQMELQRLLSEYSRFISSAEKDGIDAAEDRQFYEQYLAISKESALSEETYASLSSSISSRIDSLFLREQNLFDTLDETRNSLLLQAPYFASLLPQQISSLNSIESTYFPGGILNIRTAAGNFVKIDSEYEKVRIFFEQKASQALSQILSDNSQVSFYSPSLACIDEPLLQSAQITISNPSPLSSPSEITVQIPLSAEFGIEDAISPPQILKDAAYSSSKNSLLLRFSSLPAYSQHSLLFEKTSLPAKTSSIKQEADSTQEEALVENELSFESYSDYPLLCAKIPIPITSASLSASYAYQNPSIERYPAYAKITLENVKKGKDSFIFSYSLPSPYSLSKTNVQTTQNAQTLSISYTLSLSDFSADFENLRISTNDFANASPKNFALIPLSANEIRSVSHQFSGGALFYSFILNSISQGDSASFSVSYTIDDSENYANYLFSLYSPSDFPSNTKALSLYAEAQSLISAGKYADAIKSLIELESLLSSSWQESTLLENEYLLQKNKTEEKLAEANNTLSYFANRSTLETTRLQLGILASQKLLSDAQRKFEEGNTKEALSLLLAANEKLEGGEISSFLNSIYENLTSEKLLLEDKAFYLSLNTTERSNINFLLKNISSSLDSSYSSLLSEDYISASLSLEQTALQISSAKTMLDSFSSSAASLSLSRIAEYEIQKQSFSLLLQNYSLHYSKATDYKLSFSFFKTPKQLESELEAIDKKILKSKTKLQAGSSPTVSENSELDSSLSSFHSLQNKTLSTLALLEKTAHSSHQLAQASISRLQSQNSSIPELQQKLSEFSSKLSESSSALKNSDFCRSLSLTQNIPKEVSLILASLSPAKPSDNNALLLALATVLLLCLLAFFLLFRGGKKPTPAHKLKPEEEKNDSPTRQKTKEPQEIGL